jgi:hypothetical protein
MEARPLVGSGTSGSEPPQQQQQQLSQASSVLTPSNFAVNPSTPVSTTNLAHPPAKNVQAAEISRTEEGTLMPIQSQMKVPHAVNLQQGTKRPFGATLPTLPDVSGGITHKRQKAEPEAMSASASGVISNTNVTLPPPQEKFSVQSGLVETHNPSSAVTPCPVENNVIPRLTGDFTLAGGDEEIANLRASMQDESQVQVSAAATVLGKLESLAASSPEAASRVAELLPVLTQMQTMAHNDRVRTMASLNSLDVNRERREMQAAEQSKIHLQDLERIIAHINPSSAKEMQRLANFNANGPAQGMNPDMWGRIGPIITRCAMTLPTDENHSNSKNIRSQTPVTSAAAALPNTDISPGFGATTQNLPAGSLPGSAFEPRLIHNNTPQLITSMSSSLSKGPLLSYQQQHQQKQMTVAASAKIAQEARAVDVAKQLQRYLAASLSTNNVVQEVYASRARSLEHRAHAQETTQNLEPMSGENPPPQIGNHGITKTPAGVMNNMQQDIDQRATSSSTGSMVEAAINTSNSGQRSTQQHFQAPITTTASALDDFGVPYNFPSQVHNSEPQTFQPAAGLVRSMHDSIKTRQQKTGNNISAYDSMFMRS